MTYFNVIFGFLGCQYLITWVPPAMEGWMPWIAKFNLAQIWTNVWNWKNVYLSSCSYFENATPIPQTSVSKVYRSRVYFFLKTSLKVLRFVCPTGWRRSSQSGVHQGQRPIPPEGVGEGGWQPSGELDGPTSSLFSPCPESSEQATPAAAQECSTDTPWWKSAQFDCPGYDSVTAPEAWWHLLNEWWTMKNGLSFFFFSCLNAESSKADKLAC